MSRASAKNRALRRQVANLQAEVDTLKAMVGIIEKNKYLQLSLNELSDRYLELKFKHSQCKKKESQ